MQYTGCSIVVSKSQIFSVVGFKTKIIFLAFFLSRITLCCPCDQNFVFDSLLLCPCFH